MIPNKTNTTASVGHQTTGCLTAFKMAEPVPEEEPFPDPIAPAKLIKYMPIGIITAFATIATIATTNPV